MLCAVAVLEGDNVSGVVWFTQGKASGPVKIEGKMEGLQPGNYGLHVHQYGSTSIGAVFNPESEARGPPENVERQAGDLGNFEVGSDGNFALTNNLISLGGESNIVGRSIVVHAKEGPGGKKKGTSKTGTAGVRSAWGFIL